MPNRSLMPTRRAAPPVGPIWRRPSKSWASPSSSSRRRGSSRQPERRARGSERPWRGARELGYIGLGNMGGALARRLLREHKMRVFDLRPEVVARFADAGGVPTQSAQALARESESDMVMTCLPTSAEVHDVLFGEGR